MRIFLTAILFVVGFSMNSQTYRIENGLSVDQIDQNTYLKVVDDDKAALLSGDPELSTLEQQVFCYLHFDESAKTLFTVDWDITVNYDITYTLANDPNPITESNQSLQITYSLNNSYVDRVVNIYENVVEAEVTNVSVDTQNLPISISLLTDVYFDLVLSSDKVRALASSPPTIKELDLQPGVSNMLDISWNHIRAARSYELEWVYFDTGEFDATIPSNSLVGSSEVLGMIQADFASSMIDWDDAARVSITENFFELPLAFSQGLLFFRVRGVGLNPTTKVKTYTDWSTEITDFSTLILGEDIYTGTFFVNGLDPDLNWRSQQFLSNQFHTTTSITYADGTGRPRQTVVLNPEDNSVAIKSHVYDYEGRETVDILPSVESSQGLRFYPSQLQTGGDQFDYHNFDVWNNGSTGPINEPEALDTPQGPGYYYSSDNDGSTPGYNSEYIPDAEGFPYSRTVLMDDGTGRVRAQSMPGDDFRINSLNNNGEERAVRYYYGNPTQEELDRLFGNEVGYASRYRKQMVIDQNGQASVTITDLQGRTVATFLAGDNPDNLFPLNDLVLSEESEDPTADITAENVTVDLEVFNEFSDDGLSLTSSHTFLVPFPTDYQIDYSLSNNCYAPEIEGCSVPLCADCMYTLAIKLIRVVGDDFTEGQVLIDEEIVDVPFSSFTDDNLGVFSSINLGIGTYLVEKVLTIDQPSLETAMGLNFNGEPILDGQNDYTGFFDHFMDNACLPEFSSTFECPQNCMEIAAGAFYVFSNGQVYYFDDDTPEVLVADNYATQIAALSNLTSSADLDLWLEDLILAIDNNSNTPSTAELGTAESHDLIVTFYNECVGVPLISDPCVSYWNRIVDDMTPGGQYFENFPDEFDDLGIPNPNYDPNAWLLSNFPSAGCLSSTTLSNLDVTSIDPNQTTLDFSLLSSAEIDFLRSNWNSVVALYNTTYPNENFVDEWVMSHPEYCLYTQYCETRVEVAQSVGLPCNFGGVEYVVDPLPFLEFDFAFAQALALQGIDGNQQIDAGDVWLNPIGQALGTANGPGNNNSGYCSIDPPSSCDDYDILLFGTGFEAIRDIVRQNLVNFLPVIDDQGVPVTDAFYSIWYFIDNPNGIDASTPGLSQDLKDLFVDFHGMGGVFDQVNNPNHMSKAQFFYGVYKFYRDLGITYYIDEFNTANCNGNCDYLSYDNQNVNDLFDLDFLTNNAQGFIPVIPENPLYAEMIQGMVYDALDDTWAVVDYTNFEFLDGTEASDQLCESSCQGAVNAFINDNENLLLSTLTSQEIQELTNQLIALCGQGCPCATEVGCECSGVFESFGGSLNYTSNQQCTTEISGVTFTFAPLNGTTYFDINDVIDDLAIAGLDYYFYPIDEPVFNLDAGEEAIPCNCGNLELVMSTLSSPVDFSTYTSAQETELLTLLAEFQGDQQLAITSLELNTWITECTSQDYAGVNLSSWSNFPTELDCENISMAPTEPQSGCSSTFQLLEDMSNEAEQEEYYQLLANTWRTEFLSKCWEDITIRESYNMTYSRKEYQYTLYYHDQAGNLVKTVPPEGISFQTDLSAVVSHRNNGTGSYQHPDHKMETVYTYNSLQQLVQSSTPDGGISKFWYDDLGRIVASQNAKQLAGNEYSYTVYDEIGRIVEAGELTASTSLAPGFVDVATIASWIATGTKTEVTRTYYDSEVAQTNVLDRFDGDKQDYLRNRISTIVYAEGDNIANPMAQYITASHYAYDPHGNVKELVQENRLLEGLGESLKKIDYTYDVLSGNVEEVAYQDGEWDKFYHRYCYDQNNRLKEVFTSEDKVLWDRDAKYFYYGHGPLARVELGEKQVNATDYAYTINGWLKGVNSNSLRANRDLGQDGMITQDADDFNEMFAEDAIGFSLTYFDGDYTAVEATQGTDYFLLSESGFVTSEGPGLYNGNISRMITAHSQEEQVNGSPLNIHVNTYMYDQAQRIRRMWVGDLAHTNGTLDLSNALPLGFTTNNTDYKTSYQYDRNGNITNLKREGDNGSMDDFQYHYVADKNQLVWVEEGSGISASAYDNDLDGHLIDNYDYDEIGQLVEDDEDLITHIDWNVQNKIKRVVRAAADGQGNYRSDLEFVYDPLGNRVAKIEKPRDTNGNVESQFNWIYTVYTRDAQGNSMATYTRDYQYINQQWQDHMSVSAHEIYGSKRLGTTRADQNLVQDLNVSSVTLDSFYAGQDHGNQTEQVFDQVTYLGGKTLVTHTTGKNVLGDKSYELSNHLGNVLATISDAKTPKGSAGNNQALSYVPRITSLNDYYPFGMLMPGRTFAQDDYRYGFQGQEIDDEIKGAGNSINYKYRVHDPRIGRFLSIDPLSKQYPFYSPYAFSGNRVIDAVEIEGLEPSKNTAITSPDKNFKAAAADVCVINDKCQISNAQTNGQQNTRQAGGLQLNGTMTNTPVTGGLSSKTEGGTTYVSDTQAGSAEDYNMWVNAGSTFVVDESQASGMNNYNLFVSTVLLNNFATGEGPENYVFPENGIVSSMMKNSIIVQNALTEFRASGANTYQDQYSFGLGDLASNVSSFMTPFNVEGFVGSGTITMVKTETSIKVTVFNMTSLYSGAYTAKTGATSFSPPTSNVRDPDASSNTYYGNISQTFSFTVPLTQ